MNIVNVMLWMKRNAYEDSTIKKTAKLLRHLKKNCNTADPEAVKLFERSITKGTQLRANSRTTSNSEKISRTSRRHAKKDNGNDREDKKK
jgi:hypothetical protein